MDLPATLSAPPRAVPPPAPAVPLAEANATNPADDDDESLSIEDAHVWWALAAMLLGSAVLWGFAAREHPAPASPGEAYVQERIGQYHRLRRGDAGLAAERCLAARQVWMFYAHAGTGTAVGPDASRAGEWADTVERECAGVPTGP